MSIITTTQLHNQLTTALEQYNEATRCIADLEKCWDLTHDSENIKLNIIHCMEHSLLMCTHVPQDVWLELHDWFNKYYNRDDSTALNMLVIPQLRYILIQHLKEWRHIQIHQQARMKTLEKQISIR